MKGKGREGKESKGKGREGKKRQKEQEGNRKAGRKSYRSFSYHNLGLMFYFQPPPSDRVRYAKTIVRNHQVDPLQVGRRFFFFFFSLLEKFQNYGEIFSLSIFFGECYLSSSREKKQYQMSRMSKHFKKFPFFSCSVSVTGCDSVRYSESTRVHCKEEEEREKNSTQKNKQTESSQVMRIFSSQETFFSKRYLKQTKLTLFPFLLLRSCFFLFWLILPLQNLPFLLWIPLPLFIPMDTFSDFFSSSLFSFFLLLCQRPGDKGADKTALLNFSRRPENAVCYDCGAPSMRHMTSSLAIMTS